MLIASLSGCHWDLFGGDAPDRASKATAASYSVGGTVSGLASGGNFTLLNNLDSLSIAANGVFTFTIALGAGASYAVAMGTEPTGQACTMAGGTGTIGAANVTNVVVTCTDQTYSLGGTVRGLSSSGLVLANGSATLAMPSGAQNFAFPTAIAYGSSYGVTVMAQPTGLVCGVSAGSGVMPASAVSNIVVNCTAQSFAVGGTITGLGANTGLVLANGTDTLAVPANASHFTMPAGVADGAQYNVTIVGRSLALDCSVTNGSGVMAGTNVTNITITCTAGVESVLYSFAGPPSDGAYAWNGSLLLANDGNFYGVTSQGGSNNVGTVFKVTPAGVESILWSFGNGNDGNTPYGSLVQGSDGSLYGMTNLGGLYGFGTVFRITLAGAESMLWSFGHANDGAYPFGSLVRGSDGNFYGVTTQCIGLTFQFPGAVFKISPAGVETLLWTPASNDDAQQPYGKLVQGSDGNFYGTSYAGGVNGVGAIFRISPTGAETVLWSFGGSGDGANPTGALTLGTDGNYYGLTGFGGANAAGTVFKITPGGVESVIHSFGDPGDGFDAAGSLVLGTDGNFYGMTGFGGADNSGTIFQVTPGGAETVLWSFAAGGSDGTSPLGDLILGPGGLYGIARSGGANGFGAIFTFR